MKNEFVQRRDDGAIWKAGSTVWGLCAAWNHATNPGLPMTARDHARSRTYARAIRGRMQRLGFRYGQHFTELSNGALWPKKAI